MRRFLFVTLIGNSLSGSACSSAEDLEKKLANNKQRDNAPSRPAMTSNETSATETETSTGQTPSLESSSEEVESKTDDPSNDPANSASGNMRHLTLCPDGDGFKVKFPDSIQACFDKGHLWNFDLSVCTTMRQAGFDCTFDVFFQKLQEIGIPTSERLRKAKDGIPTKPIILGCGESTNRDTIAIQMVFSPEKPMTSCASQPNILVLTGCYGKNAERSPTDPSITVQNCLSDSQAP